MLEEQMASNKVLIIIEHKEGNVKKSSLELITAADKVSAGNIIAFTRGEGSKKVAQTLSEFGVSKLYIGEGEGFANYNSPIFVDAISGIVSKELPDYIFASANPYGKDLLPRLSAKLGKSYIPDCTDIAQDGGKAVFVKPVFAGKVLADAKVLGESPVLVSMRPNVLPQPGSRGDKKNVETVAVSSSLGLGSLKIKMKEIKVGKAGKIDLQEATIIVSGGRGMKSADNFKMLQDLTDVLGAATGASRAAVDSEYATHDMQVGQTGKVVNPKLYIACGISGAIQHLAGMRTSKVIVAINKDKEAPIFKYADYGIVGDLFAVVPALTEELRKLLKE
jgi:electron transfer flavoprotein alpha subunit